MSKVRPFGAGSRRRARRVETASARRGGRRPWWNACRVGSPGDDRPLHEAAPEGAPRPLPRRSGRDHYKARPPRGGPALPGRPRRCHREGQGHRTRRRPAAAVPRRPQGHLCSARPRPLGQGEGTYRPAHPGCRHRRRRPGARARRGREGAGPESRDEYVAERVFWVPKEARWGGDEGIKAKAKQAGIGQIIDAAMVAIERDNPTLKGVLAKSYGRPQLDKQRLGELVDLISTIGFGTEEHRSKDILGRVYEYFLGEFALAEGKKGGQFYTARSVVQLLVEMLAPYKGRVYDPCCGSGGMFVQSERFIEAHGGRIGDISVFGQ